MKKGILFSFTLVISVLIANSQVIVDTTIQNKNVLFEIVCGVRDGHTVPLHDTAKLLSLKYPDKFFPIVIHAGPLATPHKNDVNLKTVYGERLDKLFRLFDPKIGTSGLYAYLNRHDFKDRASAYFTYSKRNEISIYVDSVLNNELAYANIGISLHLDTLNNILDIQCQVYYTANSVVTSNKVHIALLQQNIESFQSNYFADTSLDNTIPAIYKQPFLLRDYITDSIGIIIENTNIASDKMKLDTTINYQIPYSIGNIPVVVDDLSIVAFITEGDDGFDVVNATGAKLPKLTAILNDEKKSSVKIFPNPVIDNLYIENLTSKSTIQIFNQLGELIYDRNTISSQEIIDFTAYIKGVYFVCISNASTNCYYKFIKI